MYSDTSRVAFECRIDTFVATADDGTRLSIVWEGSNGSGDPFATLSIGNTFSPLPGYSVFVVDGNIDTLPVMFRCQAMFSPVMGDNMTVATSDVAYLQNITDILGNHYCS